MDGKRLLIEEALQKDHVEKELRHREAWLSAILQSLGDGVIFVDGKGLVRSLNPVAEALTGWNGGEAAGKPLQEVFNALEEPFKRPARLPIEGVLEKGGKRVRIPGPLTLVAKRGQETLIEAELQPIRGEDGPASGAALVIRDCGDHIRALSALRRSEASLQAILSSTLQLFILMDRDSRILTISPVANRWSQVFIDRDVEEGVDRLRDVLPDKWRQEFDDHFPKALKGESVVGEVVTQDVNGRLRTFETNYTPVFGPGGEITGVCLTVANIGRRKKALMALERSEARFRSLVQQSSDVIILLTASGAMSYVSPAIEHILGYEPEELEGTSAFKLAHPHDREDLFKTFMYLVAHPESTVVREFRYLRKDGSYIHVEAVARNLFQDPMVGSIVVNARDITERRRAEAAVRLNLERRAAISSQLPILLYTLEPTGDQPSSWISENAYPITGYPSRLFFEDSLFWEKLLHPEDVSAYREAMSSVLGTGASKVQYRVRYADGTYHWILDSAVLISDEDGNMKEIAGAAIDITDRVLTEERLLESEEDFRTLFQSAGEGVILVSEDETVQYSNSASDEIFGVRPRQLVGRNLKEFLSNEDFAKVREQTAFRKTGRKSMYELRILRPDGPARDILLTGAPRFSKEGTFLGAFGIFADITERRKIEEQVLRGKLEWEAAFDAVPYLVVLTDQEGRIVRCNKATAERLGCDFKDLLGQRVHDIFYGRKSGEKGAFAGGGASQAESREVRFPHLQGWFTVAGYPMRVHEGMGMGHIYVITDVTRQRAMQAERRRLATAIDNAAEAVMILEAEGLVVYVNPAFERVTGFWADEVLARRPFFWLAGIALEEGIRGFQRAMVDRSVWHGRIAVATKGGSVRELEGGLSPIPDAPGSYMGSVVVLRDVTEELTLRRKVEKTRDMERLGRLVGGVAHEIRNPLNAIQAATEALSMDLGKEEEHRPLLDLIRTQVDRMSGLTRDLLDLGRPIQRSAMALLPLSKLCEGAVTTWQQSGRKKERHVAFEPETRKDAAVFGDAGKLQQVLINLLDNASQHSKPGTEIRLTTVEDERSLKIRVADQGEGIAPANLPRLFEPFFTTKRGGTGLGLSLVKHILEEHGGEVTGWNNDPPPGCTFEIRLPVPEKGEA